MRTHHTKDKGDLAVANAIADLASQGFVVLTPLSEHAPFDLVGYRLGAFVRVQVKYRALSANGTIEVQFRSCWADSKGSHTRALDKDHVDVICIFCPETRFCYYVNPKQFERSVTLRVTPARNGQARSVLHADAFRLIPG